MSDKYIRKGKTLISIAVFVLLVSIGINIYPLFMNDNGVLEFTYINTKDIAMSKEPNKDDSISVIAMLNPNNLPEEKGVLEEIIIPKKEEPAPPRRIWYLPTEMGEVSQYPSYYHMAYDITSPRGYAENIFPIANGVISGIYRDSAGANIVTIRHNIDGKIYTSQYVHLSVYANGLYVGKPVTINDCIGRMGNTGISTGVHLHITVLDDCNLFGEGYNCRDLNAFFNYGKQRISNGYIGLGSVISVPPSWSTR